MAVLVRERGTPSWLRLAGATTLFEPNDLYFESPEVLSRLATGMSRLDLPLLLDRIPLESPTIEAIQRASRGRALVLIRRANPSPVLSLDGRDPLERLNPKRRSDLRRARRRAERLGGFSFHPLVPSLDDVSEVMERAMSVEAASWKGQAGTALANDPSRGAFYRELARLMAATGRLRVFFGRIGAKDAAMQIAVQVQSSLFLLKIGCDASFSGCSPGQLLMEESVRFAQESGIASFELLGSVEPWTGMWTKEVRDYASIMVLPFNSPGARCLCRVAVSALRVRAARLKRVRGGRR